MCNWRMMLFAFCGLCLTIAGCKALPQWNALVSGKTASGQEFVFAGSPQVVAGTFAGLLGETGLNATVVADGATFKVSSTTKSGKKLNLIFSQEPTQSTATHLRFDWENGKDEQLHLLLVGLCERQQLVTK